MPEVKVTLEAIHRIARSSPNRDGTVSYIEPGTTFVASADEARELCAVEAAVAVATEAEPQKAAKKKAAKKKAAQKQVAPENRESEGGAAGNSEGDSNDLM